MLRGPGGDVTLVWRPGEKGSRRRALPRGDYRLRTVRIERMQGGAHWFVSITAPPKSPARKLLAGRVQRIAPAPVVRFEGKARRKGNELRLGFAVIDAARRGMSVYRNDKRVPVTYRVQTRRGNELASGRMNYG